MKSMKRRAAWLMIFTSACLIALAAAGSVSAGDYYVYRDSSGKLVLSNNPPPPSGQVVKKEALPDITDQELAEARAREEAVALDNRLSNLENAVGDLSENLRFQNSAAEYAQPGYGDGGVVVGVTNGFFRPRRPPMRRPTTPNGNSLPGGTTPAGSLPGGSIPAGSLPGGKIPAGSLPGGRMG
jgi:Domain of unknown function (DUF4124)